MVLAVTNDEYELPVIIADTYKEMVKKSGVSETSIYRQCKGRVSKSMGKLKFVEVKIDEEEVEEWEQKR